MDIYRTSFGHGQILDKMWLSYNGMQHRYLLGGIKLMGCMIKLVLFFIGRVLFSMQMQLQLCTSIGLETINIWVNLLIGPDINCPECTQMQFELKFQLILHLGGYE